MATIRFLNLNNQWSPIPGNVQLNIGPSCCEKEVYHIFGKATHIMYAKGKTAETDGTVSAWIPGRTTCVLRVMCPHNLPFLTELEMLGSSAVVQVIRTRDHIIDGK